MTRFDSAEAAVRRLSRGGASLPGGGSRAASDRLREIDDFGADPGALRMLVHIPENLPPHAPLVVVLHGCTQTAAGYDAHSGWSRLADSEGFAVLYPEQRRENNAQGCFNWFLPSDSARGLGETRSIRSMIETAVSRFGLDDSRVFVTGLSAGGAMAAALLADYPELFAGGAVIAGLPCGAAANMGEAFRAMSHPEERSPAELGDLVRARSGHAGPWPRISIWHGAADTTVTPKNADALVKQWTDVHSAPLADFREETTPLVRRRVWRANGRDVVELNLVSGMGHGAPLDGAQGERKGPFMLDVGLSSTRRIAGFWGLADPVAAPRLETTRARPAANGPAEPNPTHARSGGVDVGDVISRALRAAGLMK